MGKRTTGILVLVLVAYLVLHKSSSSKRTPVGVDVGPVTGIEYA